MKINLTDFHPIATIRSHSVFASNGNVVLGYKINLPEIYSLSEKDFDDLHGAWFQALKGLPAGTVVHKQDVYQKTAYAAASLPNTTFLEKSTYNYFKDRQYMAHTSYLFFCWPKNKAFNKSGYSNPFKKLPKNIVPAMDMALDEFKGAVRDAVNFINNSKKLHLTPLNPKQIEKATTQFFNCYQEGMHTDMVLDKDGVQIGDHFVDVLAVNNEGCFGESIQSSKINDKFTSDDFTFHQGFIDGLGLHLNENHMVNQVLYLDDKHRWRKLLEKRVEELKKSSNFGTQNKVVLEKIQDILRQINHDESSRVIRGHLNVIFWCQEVGQLNTIASKIKAEFKELDMIPYAPRGEARKHYILNSYFGYSANFSDEDLYVTDLKHALCLFLNNTNYKTDDTGVIFNDRQHNIPVLKDVWDENKKRIKARNFAIFAPTGEGKSFLANNILRQYFEQGVRLVIIDLGGSYTKFAKLYPDDHAILRYEQGKNLGINPFYKSPGDGVPPEQLEDLSTFLLELSASGLQVAKGQEVAMKKVLRYYYQNTSGSYSLEGFYRFVEDRQDTLLNHLHLQEGYFDIAHFLHIMSEYVGEGLYSFLFETKADQAYKIEEKRLIIFELDEVRDNKEILSVMLKLIKSAIQRTVWQNSSEKGIILFDEFAKQLRFENVLESVEFYYQAIRKQNGAIGIILQSINQLPENSTSASILENTQIIYSLRNEKGYADLKKRLNLSAHDLNQLRSMRNNFIGERKYTELFLKIGKESNIFRLEVPPEVFAAYLTDGTENEIIMNIWKKTGNMETAIREYVKNTIKNKKQ